MIRTMLIGALGCNIAWGIIDALLYLMACLAEKGRGIATLHSVRNAKDQAEAHRLIADVLPSTVVSVLDTSDFEKLRLRMNLLPEPASKARLNSTDWLGAVGVFMLVFVSTLPVALPFVFLGEVAVAMRISNAIAVALLFLTGFAYGRCVGRHPWLVGFSMVGLGSVLVALTMALGG